MNLISQLPRFRAARAKMNALAEHERWSRSEIESWQLERINDLWSRAVHSVPYYQQLAANSRLPKSFQSIAEFVGFVPILDKGCVKSDPLAFLSATSTAAGHWHRTGGSSGTPMQVYWTKAAHLEMLRTKYRLLQMWDIDIFDRSAFLWGHSGSVAPGFAGLKQRLRRPVEDYVRNRLRLSAYRLGENDLTEHAERLARFRPVSLYGYSSAVGLLAAHAQRNGYKFPSLKLAIVSGEPASEDLVSQIANDLQCDVAIEYGSVECGVMATGDREGQLRVREDAVFLETIPNQFGNYDIVVTVLNNPAFPLIRYRIEDLTSQPIDTRHEGFAVLSHVTGRQNDALVARSGRRVHSIAVKHVLEHFPQIRRFRAHQDLQGDLLLTLETDSTDDIPCANIRQQLSGMLEGYPVSIETVTTMNGNLAGKHRWVISDLIGDRVDATRPLAGE